jgi:uncharacterized iron-regulated protein
MKRIHILTSWALTSILSFIAIGSLYGQEIMPSQNIEISFDLDRKILFGKSILKVPPNTEIKLQSNGLKNFTISQLQEGQETPLTLSHEQTIHLACHDTPQTYNLHWQVSAPTSRHGSVNLISRKGIALVGSWHPAANQDMQFSLIAHLPKGFSGITEGNTITTAGKGEKKVLKATAPQPLQAINFIAGPYTIHKKKVGKTMLYIYIFPEDDHLSQGYLTKAAAYIRRYEKLIGEFPYSRYSIVENRLPTGYGMPGFTLLGQAVIRLPFIKDTSLGHEILHSWFGNAVALDQTGNWCEGLTTALADQSFAEDQDKGIVYRRNQILRYTSLVHTDNTTALIDFNDSGHSQPMAQIMRAIGYNKGSMFFYMLRNKVGDKQFFHALQKIYTTYKFKRIGWPEIESVFCQETKQDLTPFFGQWLLRHDIPDFIISTATFAQKQGTSVAHFTIRQNSSDPCQLDIPVIVDTLTGQSHHTVALSAGEQQFSLPVDSIPTAIILDPDFTILRRLQPAERPPALIRFLGAEHKTVVVPDNGQLELFQPLMAAMEQQGCTLVAASKLTNSELSQGSFLFLGTSRHTRGLFGAVKHPQHGFTLDVRPNPLAPEQVMVLVSSSTLEETTSVVRKLSHYGSYSYLHFVQGIIQVKKQAQAENGIRHILVPLPDGVPADKAASFSQIIEQIRPSRVIYVGETHTDYGTHLFQLQVIQALYAKNPDLMIGMEMFPKSSQQVLDDYISGKITDEREFLAKSNYFSVWGFDYRLYRDIIEFARSRKIPIKGLNLDKKIVSSVFRQGSTDALSQEQWQQVAQERDVTLPGYQKRLLAIHANHGASPHGKGFGGFLQAQSFWDETMAESVVAALQRYPERKMIVIAGTGHVYKDSAIPPRVARRMPVLQSVLISNNGVDTGQSEGRKADFLMFTQEISLPPAGKIGVMLDEIDSDNDEHPQVIIQRIDPAGKGLQAGLAPGDIISQVDGFPVHGIGDLKAALMDKSPGESIVLEVQRNKQIIKIPVELSNMDQAAMILPPGHPKK